MTPEAVARYTQAFTAACDCGSVLCIGQDLRPSSLRIAADVAAAARGAGLQVIDCGAIPTPALALAAAARGGGAVMVTGSHIPADRNGLKFYTRSGEITKEDEGAILSHLTGTPPVPGAAPGPLSADGEAAEMFIRRYVAAFGAGALSGRRVGLYAHSAVGRDLLATILTDLGADVVPLGRSDHFIPVDTEAVDAGTRAQIGTWVQEHGLHALVSTDGDSDRPLLADETGAVVPGDILGQITAEALRADTVVTPISSNSGVTQKGFGKVIRTRIGSPFVIAGMAQAGGDVVGYEANGGFLLGFEAQGPAGPIAPLRTRDCVLPLIVVLHAAAGAPLSRRIAQEPPVTTLSDRLQDVAQEISQPLIARLTEDADARASFLAPLGGGEATLDLTDGLRMTLPGGQVVHIRPSGNAPELRLYVEAGDAGAARALMKAALAQLKVAVAAAGG
jgi:phosphomannomutase